MALSNPNPPTAASNPGNQTLRICWFFMVSPCRARSRSFRRRIQSETWASARRSAATALRPLPRRSSYFSSRCPVSSRTISGCAAANRAPSRSPTNCSQSGTAHSGNQFEGVKESAPLLPQGRQGLAAGDGDAVRAALAPAGRFLPGAFHQATGLQAVEQRIERGHVETQFTAAAGLDALGDFVAVQGFAFEDGEYGQLGASALHVEEVAHLQGPYI